MGDLYVNGQPQPWNQRARPQKEYRLTFPKTYYEPFRQLLKMGLELSYLDTDAQGNEVVQAFLSQENLDKVKAMFPGVTAERLVLAPAIRKGMPFSRPGARTTATTTARCTFPARAIRSCSPPRTSRNTGTSSKNTKGTPWRCSRIGS